MIDQVYYKIQYPLKKAIDLMKDLDKKDLNELSANLNNEDKELIINFIAEWNDEGKQKISNLINELRTLKQ